MMGWGLWGPGVLLIFICMVAMAWMMMGHGHGGHGSHSGGSHGHRTRRAGRILAERLARGEIDIEEYKRRLVALHESDDLDQTEEAHHGC